MAGLRDRLIHKYFGVNPDVLWQIASAELSEVASSVKQILEAEQDGG